MGSHGMATYDVLHEQTTAISVWNARTVARMLVDHPQKQVNTTARKAMLDGGFDLASLWNNGRHELIKVNCGMFQDGWTVRGRAGLGEVE